MIRPVHTYNTHRHYIYSAEYLRSRIRADRERRYACFLAVVRRMQAVFRRRQLLKRRDEERRRAEEAATRALQDWGRRSVGVLRAKQELDRRVRRSWMDVRCVTSTIVGCPDPELPSPSPPKNTPTHSDTPPAAARPRPSLGARSSDGGRCGWPSVTRRGRQRGGGSS